MAAKLSSEKKEKAIAGDFSAFVMSSHTLKATHFKHGYFIISAAFDEEAKSTCPTSGLPSPTCTKHTEEHGRKVKVRLSFSRKCLA